MLQNEMEKFAAEKWTVEWVLPLFSIDLPGIPTYRHPVPSDYLVLKTLRYHQEKLRPPGEGDQFRHIKPGKIELR
jgi:hypothetical protein